VVNGTPKFEVLLLDGCEVYDGGEEHRVHHAPMAPIALRHTVYQQTSNSVVGLTTIPSTVPPMSLPCSPPVAFFNAASSHRNPINHDGGSQRRLPRRRCALALLRVIHTNRNPIASASPRQDSNEHTPQLRTNTPLAPRRRPL
jgi:hypothetical protein